MVPLTSRELAVLRLLRDGKEMAAAARELGLSEGRVKRIAASARHKLCASNSTHAASIAISIGAIEPVETA